MEELTYMVCVRVEELDDPVEGSTTTACVDCGHDIWISAASRKRLAPLGALPLCNHCAETVAKDAAISQVEGPDDGQMGEIKEHLRKLSSTGKIGWDTSSSEEGEDLFEVLKLTASQAGEQMQSPTDNWGSMCVMEDYNGTVYPPVPITKILKDGVPKELIAKQLIPAMIQAAGCRRVLFGLSIGEGGLVYGEDEAGSDQIFLIDITADGVQQVAKADIFRDGPRPYLSEWEDVDHEQMDHGIFTSSVIATLQLVRTLHES